MYYLIVHSIHCIIGTKRQWIFGNKQNAATIWPLTCGLNINRWVPNNFLMATKCFENFYLLPWFSDVFRFIELFTNVPSGFIVKVKVSKVLLEIYNFRLLHSIRQMPSIFITYVLFDDWPCAVLTLYRLMKLICVVFIDCSINYNFYLK